MPLKTCGRKSVFLLLPTVVIFIEASLAAFAGEFFLMKVFMAIIRSKAKVNLFSEIFDSAV
jgi:hypothetical protein